jgi:hypothetical protein
MCFVTICLFVLSCIAYDDVRVKRVSSDTEDLITFQISVAKTKFAPKEIIQVNYVVKNMGNKTVYLVTEPNSPTLLVKEIKIIEILSPVIYPNAHFRFNYDLIKIRPKKTYKGKLLVEPEKFLSKSNYTFEKTAIQVGFSYLFDVSELNDCKKVDYSLPCLTEVYEKSKSLTIGNLLIEIKQP